MAKILIVEDEIITAQAIAAQLKRLGYEVADIVNSGTAALAKVVETRPDLVLMDIVLKRREMDGIAAAAQIRTQFKILVVYLTAHSEEATLAKAKITEPFGYIVKPFNQRDLRIAIEIALYKHKSEQQLLEREELLSTILDSTSDGMVATDHMGQITYINPVAETLAGWQSSEALGKNIAEVIQIVDEATDTVVENPVLFLLKGAPLQDLGNNRILIARDGTKRPIADRVSPMRQENDTIKGTVLVFWDISERRQAEVLELERVRLSVEVSERQKAEAEVRKALVIEQELSELKSRFVAMVSHEYRTPLAVILTSTELLKRYGSQLSDEKKETYFDRIQAGVKQMAHLMEEVLTFSKAEADELDFNPTQWDVTAFCRQLVDEQQLLVDQHYTLKFDDQGSKITAELDKQLLRHIVTNLLSNAIKYSPKNNTIYLVLFTEADKIVLRVEDQGIGIPEAEKTQLFSPFFRASNVSTIAGTGMGLSIVKKCVDIHGGDIAIESEINAGTSVTVTLPLTVPRLSSV
ncbi:MULTISPECIES: ATP-binding protein [unclassified Coleofasciculus]|uniref:hybrid sensor histidine kinase/response regulator n=1 Tax=unclassified Coleofasciculus TaxID=2692782 RepID=UPI002AD25BAF|nr:MULTISPECIES: ATP-binding protein [unclassified Coleofasciculus]